MELRRYTLALDDISLVKIATFMKLRVTERVRGSKKDNVYGLLKQL
jgi:hypothetical protein